MEKDFNKYEAGQVILIDKPLYWTSFDIVRKIRSLVKIKKVGHAGTLDPLATGLLIVCTGKFTKKINEYMGMEKEYTGTFTLGAVTPTYDLESQPEDIKDISTITEEQIHKATEQFTGEIQQVPPMHSAVKKEGKPVYLLARKGIDLQLEPRTITINNFTIEKIELPIVHFRVVCTTGTYIRSLANDYGKELGTGAYLSSLRRTRIGNFSTEQALGIEDFTEQIKKETLSKRQSNS
ncbi:tRNA pseudouridine(55) synthase TruB [Segetibacter koreensis]|uniref:tRNA pseudouridine(55) synthase TruB n=1 Tax=Segetibacter koreensis TaxID=398037 RepID=UPI00035C7730|nr:tRNA pseudouridine(55) synthase TruB [Segetibacter koreensis]